MQRCRVLIVDDQRDIRRMLRAALETLGAGVSVTDVPSGEEAILVIARQPVDLLISDVRLPGISGLELIERTRIRNPELRLILITGMTDEDTRLQLEKARADRYFYKPLAIGEFLDGVKALMRLEPAAPPPPAKPAPVIETPARVEKQAAASPPVDAPAPETPRPAAGGIPQVLADLRRKSGAVLAALVNRAGEVTHLDGSISAEIDEWVSVLQVASETADPGGRPPGMLIFAPGSSYDFWMTPSISGLALVVGGAHQTWNSQAWGDLAAALWQATADLRSAAAAPAPVPAAPGEAHVDEQELQSLDALFGNLGAQNLGEVDADAFWELAAEDHNTPGEREGGMTYDEARRLGLAPEED